MAEVRRDLTQRLGLSAAAVTNLTCTEVVLTPPPPPSPAPAPALPPSPHALAFPSSQQRALLATPDPSVLADLGVIGPHGHPDQQQQQNRHQHHHQQQQRRVLQASADTAAEAGGGTASSSRIFSSGALPGCMQGRPPSITMDVSVRLPADSASTLAVSGNGNGNGLNGYSGVNGNNGPGPGGLAGHVLSGLSAWQQEAAAAASSAMEVCLPAADQIATSTQVRDCVRHSANCHMVQLCVDHRSVKV